MGGDSWSHGSIECFKKILKEEGGKAFFKGCYSSNIIRGTREAIVLVLYHKFQASIYP